jgi:hypothetical protein
MTKLNRIKIITHIRIPIRSENLTRPSSLSRNTIHISVRQSKHPPRHKEHKEQQKKQYHKESYKEQKEPSTINNEQNPKKVTPKNKP